ncbi:MAG TPA: glutathione S-transferase family protein [Stellaceae bacterium]|jgi:glutathione S-transferase|nr:glutathione S-transferase family protein [Stellaceae bacterium]
MLKIWGRTTSSNVQKVLWCCAELGLEYERTDWGGPFGGNQNPEYLRLNPNGLVPTVVDGDLVMWESNTICRYLCTTRNGDALYPKDPAARTHVERWMDWQLAVVGGPMGMLLQQLVRLAPEQRDTAAAEGARRRALAAWTIVDEAVGSQTYLAGDHLSLAEIVLGTQIYRWFTFPIERPELKNLRAWYDRCLARPGFEKHIVMPIT